MSGSYWDEAWNVCTGCTPVSPGCEHCWAESMARRFNKCRDCEPEACGPSCYFAPTFHPDRLDQPLHWRKPRRVFVCDTSDLFHKAFTDEDRIEVFARMALATRHRFLVLTKRGEQMQRFIADQGTPHYVRAMADDIVHDAPCYIEQAWPLPNVWAGTTICNQPEADRNIPLLLATPAAVRWVSYEPALSPVDFTPFLGRMEFSHDDGYTSWYKPSLNWVVVGGESGPGARPMRPEWALSVYRQCKAAGTAFFWKQAGTWLDREHTQGRYIPEPGFSEMTAAREYPAVAP